MATYYFLGGGSNPTDWGDTGNWYDAASGGTSGWTPTSSDDVIVLSEVDSDSGGIPEVNSLTIDGTIFSNIGITVTAGFLVTNYAVVDTCSITGYGTVELGSTLSANSGSNLTYVTGDVTFANTGYSGGEFNTSYAQIYGNVYIAADCVSTINKLYIDGNLIYTYGNTATVNYETLSGQILYADYPTLYYNNAVSDGDWANYLNWWVDSMFSQQSSSAPNSTQTVYLYNSVSTDSSFSAYANTVYIESANFIDIQITAEYFILNDGSYIGGGSTLYFNTISVTLNQNSYINNAVDITVSDSVFMNDTSYLNSGSVINGNVTVNYPHAVPFDVNNGNYGTINGSIVYSGYLPRTVYFHTDSLNTDWNNINNWWDDFPNLIQASYIPNSDISLDTVVVETSIESNSGSSAIVGDLIVNSGDVSINITCNTASFNNNATFGSYNSLSELTQASSPGDVNIIFSDLSINYGIINPVIPVVFEDGSSHESSGYINGDANIYYPVNLPVGGAVSGTITYFGYTYYFNDSAGGSPSNDGDWNNPNNWYLDNSNTIPANNTPTEIYPGDNVTLQTSVFTYTGGSPTSYDLSCGANSSLSITNTSITVNGLATFENDGTLGSGASINGYALFKDTSTCEDGTVTLTATFTLSSAAEMIYYGHNGTYGSSSIDVQFEYGKGINGSSILGIV